MTKVKEIFLLVLFLVGYSGVSPVTAQWAISTIDDARKVGKFNTLMEASNGFLSVCSRQKLPFPALKCAHQQGGAWHLEVVDDVGDPARYASAAMDANDLIHVAYEERTANALRYVVQLPGGGWSTPMPIAFGKFRGSLAIRIDNSGLPHTLFYHSSKRDLLYMYQLSSGSWSGVEEIGTEGDVGKYNDLQLDSMDIPHVAYSRKVKVNKKRVTQLVYAYRSTTGWIKEVVPTSGNIGKGVSLALDSNNKAHISFQLRLSARDISLVYTTNAGGLWQFETVDASSGNVGTASTIVLGPDGEPRIAYYYDKRKDLRFALRSVTGVWSSETADEKGNVGRYPSLVLKQGGGMGITYFKDGVQNLLYAEHP